MSPGATYKCGSQRLVDSGEGPKLINGQFQVSSTRAGMNELRESPTLSFDTALKVMQGASCTSVCCMCTYFETEDFGSVFWDSILNTFTDSVHNLKIFQYLWCKYCTTWHM